MVLNRLLALRPCARCFALHTRRIPLPLSRSFPLPPALTLARLHVRTIFFPGARCWNSSSLMGPPSSAVSTVEVITLPRPTPSPMLRGTARTGARTRMHAHTHRRTHRTHTREQGFFCGRKRATVPVKWRGPHGQTKQKRKAALASEHTHAGRQASVRDSGWVFPAASCARAHERMGRTKDRDVPVGQAAEHDAHPACEPSASKGGARK